MSSVAEVRLDFDRSLPLSELASLPFLLDFFFFFGSPCTSAVTVCYVPAATAARKRVDGELTTLLASSFLLMSFF